MKSFYNLNLPIENSFKSNLEPLLSQPFNDNQFKVIDESILSNELILFFKNHSIRLHSCVLWQWDLLYQHDVHTDGNYLFGPKRACGINWNFSLDTSVKFFSEEGATPILESTNSENFSTVWKYNNEPVEIAEWIGPGPVIFNPQIPHRINKINVDAKIRNSVTLRFNETFYELYFKLKKYILIN